MTVEYLDLIDYLTSAADVTGLDLDTVLKVTDVNLADSALRAPAAVFGDTDCYPECTPRRYEPQSVPTVPIAGRISIGYAASFDVSLIPTPADIAAAAAYPAIPLARVDRYHPLVTRIHRAATAVGVTASGARDRIHDLQDR
jgi:hypothetical protein